MDSSKSSVFMCYLKYIYVNPKSQEFRTQLLSTTFVHCSIGDLANLAFGGDFGQISLILRTSDSLPTWMGCNFFIKLEHSLLKNTEGLGILREQCCLLE